MTDLWLPNAIHHSLDADRRGRPYADTAQKKMLLHTTEGSSIGGAISAYKRYPPHLIYDPRTRELRQHVPLNLASYALRSSESEGDGVVQVELVGFANQTPNWSETTLKRIAEDVLAPVHRMWPYQLRAPQFVGNEAYGLNGATRFTRTYWDSYTGLVGHQHSPGDRHWDPGAIDAQRLLVLTRKALGGQLVADMQTEVHQILEMLTRGLGPDAAATQNLGHSIQYTNGQVVSAIVPSLKGIEVRLTQLEARLAGLEMAIDAIDCGDGGGGSEVSGPVDVTSESIEGIAVATAAQFSQRLRTL